MKQYNLKTASIKRKCPSFINSSASVQLPRFLLVPKQMNLSSWVDDRQEADFCSSQICRTCTTFAAQTWPMQLLAVSRKAILAGDFVLWFLEYKRTIKSLLSCFFFPSADDCKKKKSISLGVISKHIQIYSQVGPMKSMGYTVLSIKHRQAWAVRPFSSSDKEFSLNQWWIWWGIHGTTCSQAAEWQGWHPEAPPTLVWAPRPPPVAAHLPCFLKVNKAGCQHWSCFSGGWNYSRCPPTP